MCFCKPKLTVNPSLISATSKTGFGSQEVQGAPMFIQEVKAPKRVEFKIFNKEQFGALRNCSIIHSLINKESKQEH